MSFVNDIKQIVILYKRRKKKGRSGKKYILKKIIAPMKYRNYKDRI